MFKCILSRFQCKKLSNILLSGHGQDLRMAIGARFCAIRSNNFQHCPCKNTAWKSLETYLSFHGLVSTSTDYSCDLDVWLKTWLNISFTQKNSLDVPNFNEVTGVLVCSLMSFAIFFVIPHRCPNLESPCPPGSRPHLSELFMRC